MEQRVSPADSPTHLGFRAAEAYIRPSPIFTHGELINYGFDLRSCTFTLALVASTPAEQDYPTEMFLPECHFGPESIQVEASEGKWMVKMDEHVGVSVQILQWWHAAGGQKIIVKGSTQRQLGPAGPDEDASYLLQYVSSLCSVM